MGLSLAFRRHYMTSNPINLIIGLMIFGASSCATHEPLNPSAPENSRGLACNCDDMSPSQQLIEMGKKAHEKVERWAHVHNHRKKQEIQDRINSENISQIVPAGKHSNLSKNRRTIAQSQSFDCQENSIFPLKDGDQFDQNNLGQVLGQVHFPTDSDSSCSQIIAADQSFLTKRTSPVPEGYPGMLFDNAYIIKGLGSIGDLASIRGDLTDAELEAIRGYTINDYAPLNMGIRKHISDFNYYIEELNRALSKLPDFEGVVHRGTTLPPEMRAQRTVGVIYRELSFTSTSRGGGFGGLDHITITSHHGKDIARFSQYTGEGEVLFKSDSYFRVLSATPNDQTDSSGRKGMDFIVEEVDL